MISSLLGISKQLEVIILVIWGIFIFALDAALFHLNQDLEELWSSELDPKLHEHNIDVYLKYVISATILIRTFTLHIFLVFYIVMLWPALFANRPNLLLPWLVVGSVRSILVNFVRLGTGICVCIFLKGHHPICLDFILSQIIQHGPSVYVWLTVLSYYQELCSFDEENRKTQDSDTFSQSRRISSMTLPEKLSTTEIDNVDALINPSRSLDSLSKTSNIFQAHTKEDKNLNSAERATLELNLTNEEVSKVKIEKSKTVLEKNDDEKLMPTILFNGKTERKRCMDWVHRPCTVGINANTSKTTENSCTTYGKNTECLKDEVD